MEKRSDSLLIRQNLSAAAALCIYEAQPSGSEAVVRCRQPEKILLPPLLADFLAQPAQFSPLVTGERAFSTHLARLLLGSPSR